MKQKRTKILIKPEELTLRNPMAQALASGGFHQRRIPGRKATVRGEKHKQRFLNSKKAECD